MTDMARTIARPRMKTTTVTPMAPYRRGPRQRRQCPGRHGSGSPAPTRGQGPQRGRRAPATWGRIDRCHVRQLAEVSVLASDLPAVRIPNSPMATASHRVPWLCIRAALISTARPPETPSSDTSEVSNALPTNPASHVTNRAGAEALPVQPAEEGEHAGVVDGCDRGRPRSEAASGGGRLMAATRLGVAAASVSIHIACPQLEQLLTRRGSIHHPAASQSPPTGGSAGRPAARDKFDRSRTTAERSSTPKCQPATGATMSSMNRGPHRRGTSGVVHPCATSGVVHNPAWYILGTSTSQEALPVGPGKGLELVLTCVAGVGFEPTTFGL